MYFILEGDDKLKRKVNEYIRICLLIILISIIGISYTIYYAFGHNGELVYQSHGISQIINIDPSLSFLQVLVIIILGLGLVGATLFLAYTKGGKKDVSVLLENEEKSVFYGLETILLTTLLTLIIVIPTNILLEKYNKSENYQNSVENYGNTVNNQIKNIMNRD